MGLSYSVAIRTLGTAGEKYTKLLNSIKKQTVQPEKVVVVLPEGYEPPKEQLGTELFVFSEKGMIPQRLAALKYIESDFVLFCDDDVELEPEFVKKLSEPLISGLYSCAAGPLLEFFPPASIKYLFASLIGGACVMLHGRENTYVRILRTGGWSYNYSVKVNKHRIYDTDSIPGTCFMVQVKAMNTVHCEYESWAERTGYSAFEDRIMVSKLVKNGYKVCVVSDAKYEHNDGRTSVRQLKLEPLYAGAFNHYVYWHRFLYSLSKNPVERVWLRFCIAYYIVMSKLYNKIKVLVGQQTEAGYHAIAKGYREAKEYVKSSEYRAIPSAKVVDLEKTVSFDGKV